jgi:hypothetical protein
MSEKTVILNRPNWLGSEVGRVVKTITVPATHAHVVEDGRMIVKSGTVFTAPYLGILYDDIDITDGAKEASLMIRGSYIDAKLPASAATHASNFAAQGLYAIAEGAVTRPDFGGLEALPALTIGAVSNTSGTLAWTKVANAAAYGVYVSATAAGNYVLVDTIAQSESPSYKATQAGYYKVKALGDNLAYANSDFSTAVQVATVA